TLTHAANLLSTTRRAIFLLSLSVPHVTSTTRLHPLAFIASLPRPRLIRANCFCPGQSENRIPLHDDLTHQVRHLGLARRDRRRIYLRQRTAGGDGHRTARENQSQAACDSRGLRYALFLRRVLATRGGYPPAARHSNAAVRDVYTD